MPVLHIDIETRSAADLKKTGGYVYAEHPSTEITLAAWAVDAEPVQVWIPARFNWRPVPRVFDADTSATYAKIPPPPVCPRPFYRLHVGGPMPADLADAVAEVTAGRMQANAHNASFERIQLTGPAGLRLGFPPELRSIAMWDCTAARAAAIGLPRTLESACAALGLPVQKDKDGHKLMMRMCKPRKLKKSETTVVEILGGPAPLLWVDDLESMIREGIYCALDVEAERAIDATIPKLRPDERETWETTEEMNDTGAPVDMRLLAVMLQTIDAAEERVNARISDRTGGAVPKVSDHGALTRWLVSQGIDDAAATGVGKQAVAAMIENEAEDSLIREVLVMRRDGGGVSPKKWRAILQRVSDDGFLRGAMVYCGAASTGRWASRGAQLHNLPRGGSIKNPEAAIRDLFDGATLDEIEFMHGPPLVVASELLRPAFMAPDGFWVARGDYSQIEARVNPWLAGAAWKLDAFRKYDTITGWTEKKGKRVPLRAGPDLYKVAASGIYCVAVDAVTDAQRQIGKVGELALGFQGGKGAFQAMARGYGVKVSDDQAEEIKLAWREANPEVVGFWRGLNSAAIECMRRPIGEQMEIWTERLVQDQRDGRMTVERMHRTPLHFRRSAGAMAMILPSGRAVVYWSPRLRDVETPFGMRPAVVYRSEDSVTKQWREFTGYGGIFCENAVQATARDVMAHALREMRRQGMRPILSVHDEGICMLPRTLEAAGGGNYPFYPNHEDAARAVESIMAQRPPWAKGLPIAADSSAGPRYVKA